MYITRRSTCKNALMSTSTSTTLTMGKGKVSMLMRVRHVYMKGKVDQFVRFFRTHFHAHDQCLREACGKRCSNNLKLPLTYIGRFINFNRLTWPSTGTLLYGIGHTRSCIKGT